MKNILKCDSSAPFGRPVVPLVYMRKTLASMARPARRSGTTAPQRRRTSAPPSGLQYRPIEWNVLTADGGNQALELAAVHEGAIDLLVSDVVMPSMDGPAMAREIRQLVPGLPVLFMSGYADRTFGPEGPGGLGDACPPPPRPATWRGDSGPRRQGA